ncbi:Zinc finger, RING/FYVE/PHD-type [Phytophthora cactorum]|nr:Zinc finger, RING/FYVE/PHD-type [Phytophthora cactorum]
MNRHVIHSWDGSSTVKYPDTKSEDKYSSRSATSDVSGLVVRSVRDSRQKLVFSDQDICDDILATMPKLQAAVRNNAKGDRWKHSTGKGSVFFAELKPYFSSIEPDDDTDLLHAVAAKTELRCHLNEALSVLLHQDTDGYDSTMKSLCGKQFKKGEVLFHQRVAVDSDRQDEDNTSKRGAISVTSATMRPDVSLRTRLRSRHNRTHQLVFSTYSHQYSDKKRAVHLMKTVPKDIYDQILPVPDSSSLREIDHIGVGFDLQFIPRPGGSNRQCTQIFAHAYASDKPSRAFSKDTGASSCYVDESGGASYHADPYRSLAQFERVIRRRRFGFQSFIYFPKEYADPLLEKRCLICNKTFHFFRRDFYCQLCGHMVCGDCSKLYEVEARVGESARIGVVGCVLYVWMGATLGPIIVETPSDAWFPSENSILSSSSDEETQDNNLMGQLCSDDPEARSHALEQLGKLVANSSSPSSSERVKVSSRRNAKTKKKTQVQHVFLNIESHLNEELSKIQLKSSIQACDVSDRTRDYKYEFDAHKVTHEDIPLAPKPEAQKDARRVELIKSSGALQSDYDRSALNLIAQVAAKRLGCPIGVVSMIDDQQFHAVGHYNLPAEAVHLPRNEVPCMHSVYAEKPLVIKNPQLLRRVSAARTGWRGDWKSVRSRRRRAQQYFYKGLLHYGNSSEVSIGPFDSKQGNVVKNCVIVRMFIRIQFQGSHPRHSVFLSTVCLVMASLSLRSVLLRAPSARFPFASFHSSSGSLRTRAAERSQAGPSSSDSTSPLISVRNAATSHGQLDVLLPLPGVKGLTRLGLDDANASGATRGCLVEGRGDSYPDGTKLARTVRLGELTSMSFCLRLNHVNVLVESDAAAMDDRRAREESVAFATVKAEIERDPRLILPLHEFYRMCHNAGAEEKVATKWLRELQRRNLVAHFDRSRNPQLENAVILRPYSLESVLTLQNALDSELYNIKHDRRVKERQLSELNGKLKKLQQVENEVHLAARRMPNAQKWVGLTGLTGFYGALMYCVWDVYSWDVMEPITYFIGFTAVLGNSFYSSITKKDPTYSNMWQKRYADRVEMLGKQRKLDPAELKKLKACIADLENDITLLSQWEKIQATMAANQSIKELMAAETKASKIISEARQERGERLKQAKLEAEAEITAYRKQMERSFQMNGNTDLMGDDPSILEEETQRDIKKMQAEFQQNKQSVITMMGQHAVRVQMRVPEARKV